MCAVYRFGDFRLDSGNYELLRADRAVKLERKPMELLVLFTSKQGQLVTRAEIAERLWSKEIYVDIEHGINTAVRKLRFTLRDDPADPVFIKTVPGVGYRFVAPVIADSPAAVAASPSFPDPPLSPSHAVPSSASRPRTRRAWWLAAATVAVLLTGLVLLKFRQRSSQAVIHSLAVIPLDNLSGDPGQDYLAAGMTDELITMLARNSTLRVTSRTSVMQYKGVHRPLAEIAHALGVDGILEGSIARNGNQTHMTLQLIRADTDSHLWAESFDRDINDPSLAEEAAKEIAKQSHTATPAAITDQYVNPAAHDAYLRGKYLWFSDKMLESGAYFQKATEIQPDYAAAWAGLADYYGEAVAGDALDPRIALPQEEAAAKRALALGPDLAEAHVAIAAAYLIARWDWVDADRESQRAISLDPSNGEYWYFRACVLSAMNRKADAIEAARKSVELAPYERPTALAEMYSFDRQYDAAIAELRLRLEATPSSEALLYTLSDTWRRKGKDKEALDAWVRMLIASGNDQAVKPVRRAYAQGGWRGFLRWQLHLREQQAKTSYVSPVELANYHAQLGEREPTLTLLEEGYRQRATDMRWLQEDPAYDFLAADPQYRSILQRVGEPAPN